MESPWRRFGWQQMELVAPAEWYLSKVSTERAAGELWLTGDGLPRLQIKWLDASKEKKVNTDATLEAYLAGLEKAARKRKLGWEVERDTRLVGKGDRDVSSLECFHWRSDVDAYGLIWYSPDSQRVTLAQVNGPTGDPAVKTLARRVLGSLHDSPRGQYDLWTAYDLECRLPHDVVLSGQTVETGHSELNFTRGRHQEILSVARYGLAAIALERAGDLGDWAWQQRWDTWHRFAVERTACTVNGCPAVRFAGLKRSGLERLRQRAFSYVRGKYPIALSALAWHCAESNALLVLEQVRDPRDPDLSDSLAELIPCQPTLLDPPKR